MNAIIIARVSTEEQKEAGNSLPAQVARLESYCQRKELTVIKSCSFDESAYKSQRDEFDRIIDFILEQKDKVIVCCDKVDRLSRDIFDKRVSMLYEKALKDELELHFISDGQVINSRISAAEKFQFSISLGLAKYYSDAIGDNVKRSFEQKLRKGEWLAKAPTGYKNITNADGTTDIVLDKRMAHVVREVFRLYETGAYSMELLGQKIAKEFGINWPKGTIGKILSNPFYHGEMIIKGQTYPHRYEPLISKATFEHVQQIKDGFHKKPFKYAGLPYIYRGLIRCGNCGLAVTPEKHKGYVYYHCTQYNGNHGAKWLREDAITQQLGALFKNLQIPEDILQQTVETLKSTHQSKIEFHNRQLDSLTAELRTLTKMLDNLYDDRLKERISCEQYDRFYQSLSSKKNDITNRLSELQAAEDNYYITAKYLLELSNRAYDLFMSSEVDEKRQLVKLVLSNLRIEDEKLLYELYPPFDLIVNCSDRKLWRG